MIKLKLLVVRTGDMQKLVGFYALLGFTFHYHQHGNSLYHYSATIDGTVIEISPLIKSQPEADKNLRLGGFELDDFDVVISSLKEGEVQFISEQAQTDFGFMAVVVDPDGRRVELYKK